MLALMYAVGVLAAPSSAMYAVPTPDPPPQSAGLLWSSERPPARCLVEVGRFQDNPRALQDPDARADVTAAAISLAGTASDLYSAWSSRRGVDSRVRAAIEDDLANGIITPGEAAERRAELDAAIGRIHQLLVGLLRDYPSCDWLRPHRNQPGFSDPLDPQ